MRQYDLVLDKHWVKQSSYYRLATTLALRMGIADGKFLYCHVVAEGNVDKTIYHWSTTTVRLMTASKTPLQLILVAHICIYLP